MRYVTATDNVKIAVYDYNPCGKRTCVMVHGWPLSHKMYEYQVDLLTARGFRVVTLDLRGFGESDAPACNYGYDQMANDIYSVVRTLGIKCFTLVGFSMGGAICLRYMNVCRGYGVEQLVLLAAAAPCWTQRPGFPYGLTRESVDQLIYLAQTDRPQLAHNFIYGHGQMFASPHSEAVKSWFMDIALSASGIGTIETAISLRDEDGRADLCCVHVPTAIIHGVKDEIVPNDLAMQQHEGIPGSELYQLENSAHAIFYDELECFNQLLLQVLGC